MMKRLRLTLSLAILLAFACTSNVQNLPVSKNLVLDLNADTGLAIGEDSMVTTWTNQAPNPKAVDFTITEEGRTQTIISQNEKGTGRPTLLKITVKLMDITALFLEKMNWSTIMMKLFME